MKINKLSLLALLGVFILNSCSNDDDNLEPLPEGDYTDGFFVTNEGMFDGRGTVSFISDDLQTSDIDVYSTVNPSKSDLGQFVQSIFFDEDNAYVISNGSNYITVVDRYTFEYIGVIDSELSIPRYGEVVNGKAYVTNQGDFSTGADDYVAVIDLETLKVENTLIIGNKIDKLEEEDGLLYIQGSAFNDGNSINVLDPTSNTITTTFTTEGSLNSFDIEDGFIYALTRKDVESTDPLEKVAYLEKIDLATGNKSNQIVFSQATSVAKNLTIEDDTIYYMIGTSVYKIALSTSEEPSQALLTFSGNSAYGFDVEDDRIFIAQGTFDSDSFVEIYSLDGSLLKNITVGIGPNGFYFN
ncbi:DUF5074 domain-containing protein [Leeuwenhoekiella marinoflava]|uniref:Quinoprotein amine dehydrogenase n=2 Tax=Leeuwenhoekiella marinoflava TaxID=988 RepID=A0A4Q0PMD8_9FLAO|nr:DUF5074 domain-containing protein [Leeuwenhoekiella marinoflava]RXG30802.1 hypothetical protein DSL99_1845 [Leeuwenhoekiella marinoflava]SHF15992.1 hypothetical protein SAMN02745246_01812 [Leeuwenhoekiella marinoflava DSM 3653]